MSTEPLYIDLLITDGNFTLDSGNEPRRCNNRDSIAQDIIHSILESGITARLIGERSPTMRGDVITQLTLLIESDERLIPGTIVITEESISRLYVTAETYDFGSVNTEVNYD
ncbi:TPA: DUF2590 family protein [Escherichia coli]|uniref:DUF2590 family protein n=1 Tax=Citrobacter TaxID=544 RepID=UPI000A370DF0|nr:MULTISPECIES: DUF2590 family protein [Enterobacteriaceae]EGN4344521.1 DUF2590 family protein [Escherichia coli]EHU9029563.1 DUF2590 family protein [Escherichia coli]EHY4934485.1 DUF2590 family protein [Escherichia coli]EJP4482364.1 DUF2590 family protein [Escherichia coli]ELJ7003898.1 DUF2590 family protein [Escherichia coli]